MEKVIFFAIAFPIIGFVFYLGSKAIMNGFKAKDDNRAEKQDEDETEIENTTSNNDQLSAVVGICFMFGALILMGLYSSFL